MNPLRLLFHRHTWRKGIKIVGEYRKGKREVFHFPGRLEFCDCGKERFTPDFERLQQKAQ